MIRKNEYLQVLLCPRRIGHDTFGIVASDVMFSPDLLVGSFRGSFVDIHYLPGFLAILTII
jgi:hypothetical protein